MKVFREKRNFVFLESNDTVQKRFIARWERRLELMKGRACHDILDPRPYIATWIPYTYLTFTIKAKGRRG